MPTAILELLPVAIAAAPTPTAVLGVILLPFFPPGPAAMGRPSWPAGTLGSLS